jgi:F-type H+-transporting ATPase subunit epsilon
VRPGVIDVYEGNQVAERIFVSGGFAEVTQERCTVLADEAMPLSSLDRGEIEASLKSADAEVASLEDRAERLQGAERAPVLAELAIAQARRAIGAAKLEALQGAGH